MVNLSEDAKRLKELILKAIEDHELTQSEYDEIIHLASEDGIIDIHERALLRQLHEMIADKTIKLVK